MRARHTRLLTAAAFLAACLTSGTTAVAAPQATHPRLWLTPALTQELRARATPANPFYALGVHELARRFEESMDSGELYDLDVGTPWCGVATGFDVATGAEVFAFMSLVDQDPARRASYGARAHDLTMYVVDRVLAPEPGKSFHDAAYSTNYRGNFHGEALPLAVDWAYDRFSAAERRKIARVFMRWVGHNLTATISGQDHPEPVGVVNDPVLFADRQRLRTALNNFSASHMRNITLYSLAIDPADEPDPSVYGADNKLATMGLPGFATLRDQIKNATGAWLYTVDEALTRYAAGGVPAEGFEYNGSSTARMAETLLALHTAGYDDPALYGPHVTPQGNAFWSDVTPAFFHLVSPAPRSLPDLAWLGDLYMPANYGDMETYSSPDFMNLFGPLGTLHLLRGETGSLAAIRWLQKHMAPGGAARLVTRACDPTHARASLFYYILFDPAAAEPADPRPALPTFHLAPGMCSLTSRTDWTPSAAWLSYILPWNDVDHQHGTGNMLQLWHGGEWITKERSGYGDRAALSSYKNTLSIENDAPGTNLDFVTVAHQHGSQPAYVAAGDPSLIAYSDAPAFTYVSGDATNLYNADYRFDSDDVLEARRSVVWLKPGTVMIYDRARTATPGRFKRFWLNFTAQPQAQGTRASITTPGGQAVALDTLLPLGAAPQVDTQAPLYDPSSAGTDQTALAEPARWRVRVDAPGDPAVATFLHVLSVGPGGDALPEPQRVSTDTAPELQGARLGDTLVLFAADIRLRPTTASYHAPPQVTRHYLTGLDPDRAYQVQVTPDGADLALSVEASMAGTFWSDGGGVLAFTVQAGAASPEPTASNTWFTTEDLSTLGTPDPPPPGWIDWNSSSGSSSSGSGSSGSPPPNVDGRLASLALTGLSPAFDPDSHEYTVTVPSGTCSVTLTATLMDPTLKMQIQSGDTPSGQPQSAWLCDGNDHIGVVVYQGWTEVGRYTVTRQTAPAPSPSASAPPPASTSTPPAASTSTSTSAPPPAAGPLASLVVAGLSPPFSPAVTQYTVPKPSSGVVPVVATLSDASSMLYINSGGAQSGQAVSAWVGDSGKVTIVIYKSWNEIGRYTIVPQ